MKSFLMALAALFLIIAPAAYAQDAGDQRGTERIAAIVNSDAITASELSARLKLIVVSSGLPDTPDVRAKIKPEVLNSLIEEKLMMQEANRNKITVKPDEIDGGFMQIAKQNNLDIDQFKKMLDQAHIPADTLRSQIESQIAWQHVVEQKIRPDVVITDEQVDQALDRIKADIGKIQYLVADIFLPVGSPDDEANVRALAEKIEHEINDNHAPFQKVASQFSQAPGGDKGGDLGWVEEGQLPTDLDQALASMKEGELSKPIRSGGGYHILLLRQKTELTAATVPSREATLEKLGVAELERRQRQFLMQLKASAFIERRG